ncbi:ribosomal protein S18-alanine N-acetyltransferase [Helcococcus ovis]|uniref:[Ribosomal protein bS18]-alanine N-acetyltransferase n=1 Tax=Helcococcus ovis TaxID=72026 RepID=A0A4R9C356_9FIRM|nr:ribosomal protein S18-alanine N-acetyltransferase [Helcococcus ovis]TFF64195.1 ribosomal-protein-alanine N-acetyltransferase [Helcococcus ovis]TFF65684.1 ribosomal-protein-alanine N-acetyltransferase [Helcococcus ovis]TFF66690.1 ribosomal-protein-alanine N-acetyltransferase [Helcococcus ovis]WNZ00756.1 ribosomal protein S18-alanine N-acetyltransferase [Helcococcus ovis]
MSNREFVEIDEKYIDFLVEMEKDFQNPWPLEGFFLEMENEFTKSIGLCIDGILVGYMFYSEYLDEVNINHFVIDTKYRKKGYASEIMQELLKRINKKQLIYLEVRTDNIAAINLYKKFGLEIINTRKNYYTDGQDAYIMQRDRKEEL